MRCVADFFLRQKEFGYMFTDVSIYHFLWLLLGWFLYYLLLYYINSFLYIYQAEPNNFLLLSADGVTMWNSEQVSCVLFHDERGWCLTCCIDHRGSRCVYGICCSEYQTRQGICSMAKNNRYISSV